VWNSASGSDDSQSPEASTHGTPGTSWDALALSKLSVIATGGAADKFTIVVSPVGNFNATHDPNKPGLWKIASFTSIEGFDLSKFSLDTSLLTTGQNLGGFYVSADTQLDGSGDLNLRYVPEPSLGCGLIIAGGIAAALRRRRRQFAVCAPRPRE
jgi:hypothetical protein